MRVKIAVHIAWNKVHNKIQTSLIQLMFDMCFFTKWGHNVNLNVAIYTTKYNTGFMAHKKKPIEHALIQWILVMLRSVFLGVGSLNIQQAPLNNTVNISIPSSNTRKALLINNLWYLTVFYSAAIKDINK